MNASAFPAAARVFVVATFVTPQDANTVAIRIGLAHPKSLVVDFNKDASPEPKPTRLHPEGLRVCEFAGPATFLVNGTGKHEFVLEADGQEVARATFYVASDSPPKPRR
jgi:hypothetical protein